MLVFCVNVHEIKIGPIIIKYVLNNANVPGLILYNLLLHIISDKKLLLVALGLEILNLINK